MTGIIALVVAAAALDCAGAAVVYNRAREHFSRAITYYALGQPWAAVTEMHRGRVLTRRANIMTLGGYGRIR